MTDDARPDLWGLWVEPDGADWAVLRLNDGRRTVISRHPTEASARHAVAVMNASGVGDHATFDDPPSSP